MNREAWYVYYRMLRIYRREMKKVWEDTLLFGTGFLKVNDDGYPNHMLPDKIVLRSM